jgi:Tfp pilus assembly protein PilV
MRCGTRAADRRGITLIEVLFGAALISVLTIAVASMLRTAANVVALDDHADAVGSLRSALTALDGIDEGEAVAARLQERMPDANCRVVRTMFDDRSVQWLIVERAGVGTAMYLGEQVSGEERDGSAQSSR